MRHFHFPERPIPGGPVPRHGRHLSRSVGEGLDQRYEQSTDPDFPENRYDSTFHSVPEFRSFRLELTHFARVTEK